MAFARSVQVCKEIYPPAAATLTDRIEGTEGCFFRADLTGRIEEIAGRYRGQVQLIYMDPPFYTGQSFSYAQPMGERGYRGDRGCRFEHTAYCDPAEDRDAYLSLMRRVFVSAREMLADSGSLYLHVDYRAASHLKLLLDQVFGEENFINEIIWHYRSGGRSVRHFSRKHDTIFLYGKSGNYYFDIESAGQKRGGEPRNHMKRQVDGEGRVYFSIRSAGKEYRYYADEKVYPSDVWDDISHLQQRDPERTGYDTQKPLALLNRIIAVSSRPGDLVADLFAGSGTALAAAQGLRRRYLGLDRSPFSLAVVRKRLTERSLGDVCFEDTLSDRQDASWRCEIAVSRQHGEVVAKIGDLRAVAIPRAIPSGATEWDLIDGWALGRVEGECFYPLKWAMRSAQRPELPRSLAIPASNGEMPLAAALYDVWGRASYYRID